VCVEGKNLKIQSKKHSGILLPHRVPKTDYGLIGNQTIYVYSFLLANISEREIKTS